jgi:hypothetical protein
VHCPLPKWEVLGASAVDALMRCAAARWREARRRWVAEMRGDARKMGR